MLATRMTFPLPPTIQVKNYYLISLHTRVPGVCGNYSTLRNANLPSNIQDETHRLVSDPIL